MSLSFQKLLLKESNISVRCFLCVVYTYFRVPEPSGRLFSEIDLLFERGVSARKFASTDINAFDVALHHKIDDTKHEVDHVEKQ